MKFFLALATLTLGALADPTPVDPPTLVARDLATVTSVITKVDSGIVALDSAVQAFSGDAAGVTSASTALLGSIQSGTDAIKASSELSISDALALQSVVTGLQGHGQQLVANLKAKKPAFEKAGICAEVRQQVADVSAGSKALIAAIVAKVPLAVQPVAAELAKGVTDTLAENEATFATCTNATPAPGPAPAPAPAPGSGSAAPSVSVPAATSAAPVATAPATSAVSVPAAPVVTLSTSRPASTGTGSLPSKTTSAVQFTGAAAANVAAPLGGIAVAFAALML